MAPALRPGDLLIAARPRRPLRRGDVVVFVLPARPGFHVVKRVVGLPGECIEIRSGRLYVDGAVLPEAWADGPTPGSGCWSLGPQQVFVLGDRRQLSAGDGRQIGALEPCGSAWRVVFRYWPPRRAGRVAIPERALTPENPL